MSGRRHGVIIGFEDGGSGHKLRTAGGLETLEKVRKQTLS